MTRDFQFTPDQKAIINSLNLFSAEYLVIGGIAVKTYCAARETSDLDILLPCNSISAIQVATIFRELGLNEDPNRGWEKILATEGVRFAYPNELVNEVDILTSIDGVDFYDCYRRSITVNFGGTVFRVPSKQDLIQMKMTSLKSGNSIESHDRDHRDILLLRN